MDPTISLGGFGWGGLGGLFCEKSDDRSSIQCEHIWETKCPRYLTPPFKSLLDIT